MQKRDNNRAPEELRKCSLRSGINPHADGSAEVTIGATRILVSAALIDAHQLKKRVHVITRMLPLSTAEGNSGNEEAEKKELTYIETLCERNLLVALLGQELGKVGVQLECNIVSSDGGAAGALITAAWLAMAQSLVKGMKSGLIRSDVALPRITGLSYGIFADGPRIDLCSKEYRDVLFRGMLVFNSSEELIDIDGRHEEKGISAKQLSSILELASPAVQQLLELQKQVATDEF